MKVLLEGEEEEAMQTTDEARDQTGKGGDDRTGVEGIGGAAGETRVEISRDSPDVNASYNDAGDVGCARARAFPMEPSTDGATAGESPMEPSTGGARAGVEPSTGGAVIEGGSPMKPLTAPAVRAEEGGVEEEVEEEEEGRRIRLIGLKRPISQLRQVESHQGGQFMIQNNERRLRGFNGASII